MRNVLVTGGAGFIGSNFVHFFLRVEPEVRVYNLDALTYAGSQENLRDLPDPERHTFIKGDICDRTLIDGLLRKYQIDTIVHFAAETHVDRSILGPAQFIQTNIVGTFTLLEAVRGYWLDEGAFNLDDVRFHHVSTDEVFGSLAPGEPAWTEIIPYAPNSPYAAVSREAYPPDDFKRFRREAITHLWRWAADQGLALCGRSLRSHLASPQAWTCR
jgi:dTDP-glucose 4,6-dehydratase